MTYRTKIITSAVIFLPLVVFGIASIAVTAPSFILAWLVWSMLVMLVASGYHLIFCRQQAINAAPCYQCVSTPLVQREAVQEAREYESQYEPIVVSYPRGLYD